MTEFPIERYIELENNPYFLGRITVHQVKEDYHVEIDIIHKESHKIFRHVDIIYKQYGPEEAIITGVQRLRIYLERIEREQMGEDVDPDPKLPVQ